MVSLQDLEVEILLLEVVRVMGMAFEVINMSNLEVEEMLGSR